MRAQQVRLGLDQRAARLGRAHVPPLQHARRDAVRDVAQPRAPARGGRGRARGAAQADERVALEVVDVRVGGCAVVVALAEAAARARGAGGVAAVRPRPAVRVVVAQPVVVAAAEREAVAAAAAARACDRASEEAVGIVLAASRRVAAAVTVWRSASLSVVAKAGDRTEDERS